MTAPSESGRAVIVAAGGPPPDSPQHGYIRKVVQAGDLLVAANGGAEVLLRLGLTPDAMVGDMDSLCPESADRIERSSAANIIRHPPDKDRTDGQLAAEWALHHLGDGAGAEMIICGAFGDRFDHALALILYCATLTQERGITLRLRDAGQVAHPVCSRLQLCGQPGDTVSLIPLTERATDIHIDGFRYPLRGGSLCWGETLGVSNELRESPAHVQVRGQGILLAVHHTSDH